MLKLKSKKEPAEQDAFFADLNKRRPIRWCILITGREFPCLLKHYRSGNASKVKSASDERAMDVAHFYVTRVLMNRRKGNML